MNWYKDLGKVEKIKWLYPEAPNLERAIWRDFEIKPGYVLFHFSLSSLPEKIPQQWIEQKIDVVDLKIGFFEIGKMKI